MLPEFIPMYDNLTKKKKLPIWFHTSYTFSNFSKLPERLDRQCIHHNPLKPNNKYIIHNLPYTSLITVRQELYPARNHIFFYPIRCTHVLRSNTRVAGDHIRRFPSSIKGITTKRSSARKTISIPSPPDAIRSRDVANQFSTGRTWSSPTEWHKAERFAATVCLPCSEG